MSLRRGIAWTSLGRHHAFIGGGAVFRILANRSEPSQAAPINPAGPGNYRSRTLG